MCHQLDIYFIKNVLGTDSQSWLKLESWRKWKILMPTYQWFSTGVLQEFSKHETPDYLVRDTDPSLFRWSNKKKNDHSQYNNSHQVWMNQNYTFFPVRSAKYIYIFCVLQNFIVVISHVCHDMKKVENCCYIPSLKIWI